MTKSQREAIENMRLVKDGDTGDGKRRFFKSDTNDGWNDIRITLDTDDCDSKFALAGMKRIVACVNYFAGREIPK